MTRSYDQVITIASPLERELRQAYRLMMSVVIGKKPLKP